MLTINDTHYTVDDFEQRYQLFSNMESLTTAEPVAICLEDHITWLALCFYLKKHKTSVMPIHPATPQQNAERMAAKAGVRVLYYHSLDNPIKIHTEVNSTGTAGLIQMSSGTTGEPKCINRSWDAIDLEVDNYIKTFTKPAQMTPVIACPVTHSYGLISGVMVALARKQSPVIVTNINPKYLITTLLSHAKPLLYSSPTMLQGLMRLWPADKKLYAVMTSGTVMSAQAFEQIRSKVSHLFQQYGCSEAGCISISQEMAAANDIGTPLPHIRIECSKDADSPAEIIAHVNTGTGIQAIHTQDLAYLEKDLSLRFLSRMDDTIIVAGLNVYPQEVEDVILTHPQIKDAVIFKTEDTFAGQRVCLHYIADEALEAGTVRQWCSEQLANFQVPQQLQQVETIERLANGKINRKKIALHHLQASNPPQSIATV